MNKPKVSIIVPIFKSEEFLERCIISLVNQTLKDIEIILVNDVSPDNSKEIMERYSRQDSRIVTIYNEVNLVPNPRNVGIRAAKADYVGFVDADDWVELDMYEKLYNKTQNGLVDVVVSNLRRVNSNYETVSEEIIWNEELFGGADFKQKIVDNIATKGGRLFTNIWKKNIIIDNNLFFLDNNVYCDAIVELWYLKAKSIAGVNKIMYNYFQNTESITHTLNNMRALKDRPEAHEDKMRRAKECGIYQLYKDVLDYRFYKIYLYNTCILFAVRYSWPRYKEIHRIKHVFYDVIPEGMRNNRYYRQNSSMIKDMQFLFIKKSTYIGATMVWIVHTLARFLKKDNSFNLFSRM